MSSLSGNIGVPVKLLYEAQGLTASIEVSSGQTFRGKLASVEDNMNVNMREVTVTHRDGHVTVAESVFLRGSHITLFVLPDTLRHAPMFKNFAKKNRSRGLGMGKARVEPSRGAPGGRGRMRGGSRPPAH